MNRRSLVYLDHNATTPLAPAVAAALAEHVYAFGNPSSRHLAGEEARELVEVARALVARLVGAVPAQVVFTGSGTEADNMAIKGIALKPDGRPPTRGFCPLTRLLARSWDRWRARFRQPVHVLDPEGSLDRARRDRVELRGAPAQPREDQGRAGVHPVAHQDDRCQA